MKHSNRQPYLDWLRILSIFGVLILHSAMPYVAEEHWHIKNNENSMLLLYMTAFLHLFRMPLLFFISGTVSYYMMQRKTALQFIGIRCTRLLIPLVVGIFIIVPPQIYMERLANGYHGNYWAFYKTVFEFKPYTIGGSFSWHHLWFIAYLFVYDIVFAPFFGWMISGNSDRLKSFIAWLGKGKRILLLAVPSIAWFALLYRSFPETNDLVHDVCYFFYWLSFVLAGFICILVPSLMESLRANRRLFISIGFASLLFFYYRWLNPDYDFGVLGRIVRPVISWSWIFGLVGYGKQYLNRSHRVLPYLNQAVYPFYILHQTVIVVLAYYITKTGDTVLMKYIYTTAITLFITMGLFHFFVKPFAAVRFLMGLKPASETTEQLPKTSKTIVLVEKLQENAV